MQYRLSEFFEFLSYIAFGKVVSEQRFRNSGFGTAVLEQRFRNDGFGTAVTTVSEPVTVVVSED